MEHSLWHKELDKNLLRREILAKRSGLSQTLVFSASSEICRKILTLECFTNSETVFAYFPYGNEISTLEIISQALALGKLVALPRVNGEEILFRYVTGIDDLIPGSFGILEPPDSLPLACTDSNTLIIVPGVVFDRKLNRCGHGKGYYDKFLEGRIYLKAIGVCYDFQLVQQLPTEPWDKPMDLIVTEKEIIF